MDKILQLLASMPTKEMGTYGGGSWSAPDVAKMTGADKVIGALQRKLGKAYGPAKFLGEVATYPVTAPLEAAYKVGNIYGQEFQKGPKGSPNKAMVKSMAASAPVLALMGAGALGKAAGKAVFGGPMESAARYRQISKIAPSSLPYAQYQVLKKLGGNKAYDLGSALTYGLHKTLAGRNTAGKILDAMVQGAGGVAPIGGASELSKSLEKNTPVRDAFMNILGGLGKGAAGGALLGGALAGGKIAGQAGQAKLQKMAEQARNKQIQNVLFGKGTLAPDEQWDLNEIISSKNIKDIKRILGRDYNDTFINEVLPKVAKLKGLNVTSKKAGVFDKLLVLENLVRKQNALEKRATTTGVNPKTDYQSQIDSLSSELEGNLSGKNSPMIEAFVKKLTKQQGSFTPFAPMQSPLKSKTKPILAPMKFKPGEEPTPAELAYFLGETSVKPKGFTMDKFRDESGFADLFGKVGGKADRWSKYHKDSSGMLTDKWGNHPLSKSDYKRQMGDWALYKYQTSKKALTEGLTKAQKETLKKIGAQGGSITPFYDILSKKVGTTRADFEKVAKIMEGAKKGGVAGVSLSEMVKKTKLSPEIIRDILKNKSKYGSRVFDLSVADAFRWAAGKK